MAKFKWATWKRSSSDSPDTDRAAVAKKQGRRPFSMSMASPVQNKEEAVEGETRQSASTSEVTDSISTQPTSEMVKLARKIVAEAEKLDKYMKENNLPEPSFDVNAPSDFPKLPPDVHVSRQEIIHSTGKLRDLAVGPRESVRWGIWGFLDVLALQIINNYGLAKLVPVDGTITLAELQSKTPLDPVNLARVIRMGITNGVFREPSPGTIAHTAASRVLAEDANLQAWVGFNSEDIFPAAAHVLQALKAYPAATDLKQAGFQFAFGTVDAEPMFATFGKDPVRARRMGLAMTSLTGGEGYEVSYLVDVEGGGYDFSAVDEAGGTFVDVGGSVGFVCVDLAKRYKKMKFVVQDLPKTIDSIPRPIHEDPQIAERIELAAHDFFTPQVVKGADVYFFRWIIHNYSTPFAIKILKSLIPALKPGARIVINDHCLREAGAENPWDDKMIRRMDMVMLSLLNAQERTEEEYRELFKAASDGFSFKGVMRPKGCRMSIIEAVWEGQSE